MANSKQLFTKRKSRVRSALKKVSNRSMRLSVFRSNRHIYAQLIDDSASVTIASASTLEKDLLTKFSRKVSVEAAATVGKLLAERALLQNVKEVYFDRGGYIYHGCVKALADAARENGLNF
jgi:large subunit ribosomal protein L18